SFLPPLPPPRPTPFPYTTLFRSFAAARLEMGDRSAHRLLGRRLEVERVHRRARLVLVVIGHDLAVVEIRRERGEPILREPIAHRSEEHTSELQSLRHLVCRLLLE